MCGIVGVVDRLHRSSGDRLAADVRAMAATLRHRGPDDDGVWLDAGYGLALGHTRLSILDLSPDGHQPMVSHDGRHVLAFNGEIYNFRDIRRRLVAAGHPFRSDSDTEVLVEAISAWGLEETLRSAVGMFAFGVWDREAQVLSLGRDRIGEKPLYYGWLGDTFVFASELKALRVHPAFEGMIDRSALTLYLRHSYVPGPRTIYTGIQKLPPGTLLRISGFASGALPDPVAYWSLEPASRHPDLALASDAAAVDSLESLLRDAIRQQMVADVPVGAFLSGGVDSATIVALMQAESVKPVRTFSIGVHDPRRDEAPAARAIAEHLGTDHTEHYVQPDDALAVIPRLGVIYDEPFADSSQIPTLLVSHLARRSVTVALTGDGGDELFAGYERYVRAPDLVHRLGWIPGPVRRQVGRTLLAPTISSGLNSFRKQDGGRLAERALRLGEILEERSPLAVHRALHSSWPQPATIVVGGVEPMTPLTSPAVAWSRERFGERMLIADARTYLPDDLLVKVDRAAMSVSLETRVPLLDHRVVELAMRLPWRMKVRDGVRKWILREVLYRHVPPSLVDGPKKGFSVPVGDWLRGPLAGWADALLDSERLSAEGIFRPEPIVARWREHRSGRSDWSYHLWTILMFQTWRDSCR
jgi:asparagine synthase (glutamine-hydrolysing)